MDHLILRSLQGRASPEEARDLGIWRESSPGNEARYRLLADLWSVTGAASAASRPSIGSGGVPDPEALIARAEAAEAMERELPRQGTADIQAAGTRRRRAWPASGRAVAAAAVFAALGFGLATLVHRVSGSADLLAESEVTTGAGEMTTLTLADGTRIRVGPRTHLRLGYEGRDRVAWLDGRAFFGVEADPSRTFTVRTRYGEAVVFGTRFEVRSEDEEFRVLVVDGLVQVSAGGAAEELHGGEMSRSAAGAPPSKSTVEDVAALLDWMGNALVFQRTPLERAIREIEARYGVDVVLESPELGELAVTASFTGQSLEEVILVLCETIASECLIGEEQVRIGIPEGDASDG